MEDPYCQYSQCKHLKKNILKVLSRVSGGAYPELTSLAYRGLVVAALEWGTPIFASASKSSPKMLDVIQNDALRVVFGCMRTTPITILLKANEPFLALRSERLPKRFIITNSTWTHCPLSPKLTLLSEKYRSPSFALKGRNVNLVRVFEDIYDGICLMYRSTRPCYFDHAWGFGKITCNTTSGYQLRNSDRPDETFEAFCGSHYPNARLLYTIGSVTDRDLVRLNTEIAA